MTLPEPSRTLWKQHHEAIDRIATAPGGGSRTMPGGRLGTRRTVAPPPRGS